MKLTLTLDYDLGEGFLAAYLDGLRAGRALASRCGACGRVALPPEPACPCGARAAAPVPLSGRARILWRSTGADGDVALVGFDGADTLSLARLQGFGAQTQGTIAPDPAGGLLVVPKEPA